MTGEMLFTVFFVILALVWVAVSPDPFARALKARLIGGKIAVANAIDNAVARIDTALNDVDSTMAKVRYAQITIKALRAGRQQRLNQLQTESTRLDNAAKQAAAAGRRDLVVRALQRKADVDAQVQSLQTELEQLNTRDASVAQSMDKLENEKADLTAKRRNIQSRASTAQASISVNELLTGVKFGGYASDAARAEEIVADLEARAQATSEVATAESPNEALDRELDDLASNRPDIETIADQMLAAHGTNPPADSLPGATSVANDTTPEPAVG